MKIKKIRNDSKELHLNEDESFDSRFDKEFEKYVDKPLSMEEFDALTKKMLEFENSSLTESTANSNGIYSLKNGWLKVPIKDDIPDDVDLEPELSEFRQRANECDSIESIDSFMDDIYKLRQESILTDGEYGKGNLVFKSLRNEGILQQLKDKKVKLENKEMSLEEALEPVPKGTTIVQTRNFDRDFKKLGLDDKDLFDLEDSIMKYPPEASLGSGVYKFRWSPKK